MDPQLSPCDSSLFRRMTADHHRMDDLLRLATDTANAGAWDMVAPPLHTFALALAIEISIEETLLFPAFQAVGGSPSVLSSLRAEHVLLRRATGHLLAAQRAANLPAFHAAHDRLMSVLTYHELKEERGVFAPLDRHLDHEARAALLARVAHAFA
jgi:hypothetical protein